MKKEKRTAPNFFLNHWKHRRSLGDTKSTCRNPYKTGTSWLVCFAIATTDGYHQSSLQLGRSPASWSEIAAPAAACL